MILFPFQPDARQTEFKIFYLKFFYFNQKMKFTWRATVKMSVWMHNGTTVQLEYRESTSQTTEFNFFLVSRLLTELNQLYLQYYFVFCRLKHLNSAISSQKMRDTWKENHHILFSKVFETKKQLLPNLQIAMKFNSLLFIPQNMQVKQSAIALQLRDRIIHTLVMQLINVKLLSFLTNIIRLRQCNLTVTNKMQNT